MTNDLINEMDQASGLGIKGAAESMGQGGATQNQPQTEQQNPFGMLGDIGSAIFPQTAKTFTNTLQSQAQAPSTKGNLGASVGNAINQTGKLAGNLFNPKQIMELGSMAIPMGEGLLARAGFGTATGAVQEASRPNSTPGSIASSGVTSGVLNSILPGLGNKLAQGFSHAAIGKGGESFPGLVKELGPIIGNVKTLPGELYSKTQPIRDQFDTLMQKSMLKPIIKSDIFGSKSPYSGAPDKPGMIGDLLKKTGFASEDKVKAYTQKLQQGLEDSYADFLKQHIDEILPSYAKGKLTPDQISQIILNQSQNEHAKVPVPVWQSFLEKMGKDIQPQSWLSKILGTNISPESDFATSLYSKLREQVSKATGQPDLYDKLQGQKQAASIMSNSLQKRAEGKGNVNVLKNLAGSHFGIPVEVALSLLGHGSMPFMGALGGLGLGTTLGTNPAIVSRAVSAGYGKAGNVARALGTRAGGAVAGAVTR